MNRIGKCEIRGHMRLILLLTYHADKLKKLSSIQSEHETIIETRLKCNKSLIILKNAKIVWSCEKSCRCHLAALLRTAEYIRDRNILGESHFSCKQS